MARRERSKYQKHQRKDEVLDQPVETEEDQAEPEVQHASFNMWPYLIIFLLGVGLYINTAGFDYALDDKLYITANSYTKKGVDGIKEIWTNDMMTGFFGTKKNLVEGGRYRPLSMTTHALEWEVLGRNPGVSHAVNILLYGFIGVVLLLVLNLLFKWDEKRFWWSIPFVATALFLAHPTHTEVGANIKSRDEIMSLLFALMAFYSVLLYLKRQDVLQLILSGVWFFLSLTSKESSVTFLGVIPLTLIFYPQANLKRSIVSMAPMVAMTGAYLLLRISVLDTPGDSMEVAKELMNQPYLRATEDERLASIFFTMGLYLKLLFWPDPLTHDYYPFHPFRTYEELAAGANPYLDWSEPMTGVSLVIYAALLLFGLYTLIQRLMGKPANILGYGILLFLGTFILFSNLFFEIGAFMNERFLFIPSLGFALPLAALLVNKLGNKPGMNVGVILATVIFLGYSAKTIIRNYAWENDYTLASSDVGTSDGSAKVKMTMGSELLDQAKEQTSEQEKQRLLKQAEQYEVQSLKIYNTYFPPLDILGNIYFEMENYDYSVHYFQQALRMKPYDNRMLTNMEAVGNMATQKKNFEAALKAFETLVKLRSGEDLSRIYAAMGEIYGKDLRDNQNALKYLSLAIEEDPKNASALQKIGIVYAMRGQMNEAMESFNRSLELNPDNARVLLNIGVLYDQLGNRELGAEYKRRAVEKDPTVMNGGQ